MPATAAQRSGPPRWLRLQWGFDAWLVTRHADVRVVLSDSRFTRDVHRASEIRAAAGLPRLPVGGTGRGVTLLHIDPPEHTRLRRLMHPLFTARRIERLRPMVSKLARDLVAQFAHTGQADLVAELALPLTVGVLCELAGLPPGDLERFGPWVRDVHQTEGGADAGRRMVEAIQAMDAYLAGVIGARRLRAGRSRGTPADVLTELACPSAATGRLGDDELIALGRDLLVGGYESTKNLIAGGMLALLTHPGPMAELLADPTLVPLAVEELLRYAPPFPRMEQRYATADIEVGGALISRGEPVIADLFAANRDPARFPDPDRLTIADSARGQLSFGPGTHHCLGAAVARLEAEVAVQTLLTGLPQLRLGCRPEDVERLPGFSPGPRSLPVTFIPIPVQHRA
ncbi:MAG: cytochrome P450 [Pseudonocardiaceae bacterium]